MPNDAKTSPEQAIAIIMVEAKTSSGKIVLPNGKPMMLDQYKQMKTVTIPGHIVIRPGETLRMGRDSSNELVLDIPNVSRFHAILTATSSSVRLSDLSSTNGTFVNGNPVSTPVKLDTGDIVDVGPAQLKVELLASLQTRTNLTLVGTKFDPITTAGNVTVLVADVCGYTKLSEELPSEDIAHMLQRWFELASNIIKKFSGNIDKYIGDCVMAFWKGTDENAKQFAIEATKAAVEIKKQTKLLSESEKWPHRDFYSWDCRVSLNTGQVMIGKVGDRGARDFTILGDVVNVAFRLNTVAGSRGYDFVLGDGTANHVKEAFKLTRLGPVQVKGRSQKVVAFTLS
ncbi:MAG: FHA domain-containing protein [bacterium]